MLLDLCNEPNAEAGYILCPKHCFLLRVSDDEQRLGTYPLSLNGFSSLEKAVLKGIFRSKGVVVAKGTGNLYKVLS